MDPDENEIQDTVDLIASGYDWTCPDCEENGTAGEMSNHTIEIPSNLLVTCASCGRTYQVGDHFDALE